MTTAVGQTGDMIRSVSTPDGEVVLELKEQVLSLEVPAADAREKPLVARLSQLHHEDAFVSLAALGAKAKAFDDGLYAALELAAAKGTAPLRGRTWLLRELAALAEREPGLAEEVTVLLRAALALTDGTPVRDLPPNVRAPVEQALAGPALGFYCWSHELAALFRRDRALQGVAGSTASLRALARGIHGRPAARAEYEQQLELASRLTNALAAPDLRLLLRELDGATASPDGATPEGIRLFPPSVSIEGELAKRVLGAVPIPGGFDLIARLIEELRGGTASLAPNERSGAYDHFLWSLEPLVLPERTEEATRLALGAEYTAHLRQQFRGLLALGREAHVKQLEDVLCGMAPAPVRRKTPIEPALDAEPMAEHYRRRALVYRFLRLVLEATFDGASLASLRRVTPDGIESRPLIEELRSVEGLFLGAWVTVRRQLGLETPWDGDLGSGQGVERDATAFADWARAPSQDRDADADVRVMVPLYFDAGRMKWKVLAVLGWRSESLEIGFARPPRVVKAPPGAELEFTSSWRRLADLVTVEILVDRLLDRDAFRTVCDRSSFPQAIVAELTGIPTPVPDPPKPVQPPVEPVHPREESTRAVVLLVLAAVIGLALALAFTCIR
jgi:hypothetical protein